MKVWTVSLRDPFNNHYSLILDSIWDNQELANVRCEHMTTLGENGVVSIGYNLNETPEDRIARDVGNVMEALDEL